MSYKILVPLDGSAESESALTYARLLAAKTQVSLDLLRCFEPPAAVYTLPDLDRLASDVLAEHNLQEHMLAYLEQKKGELGDLSCDVNVVCGHPATEILSRAESTDLCVIARHGRSGLGRWLLGGVTAHVARASSKPVIVVPCETAEQPPKLETIMVCLDGSDIAERGLEEAVKLAAAVGAQLTLYRFVPLASAADPEGELIEAKAYLQSLREKHSELVFHTFAQPGAWRHNIVESAQELKVDLLVMGSHGRRGVARWLLGSVAEHALHHIPCPIMIVH